MIPVSPSDHLLDLPVLELNGRAPAQEPNQGHELVALTTPDYLADQAAKGSARDANESPHGRGRLLDNREARAQHPVDLSQVAFQRCLVDHVEHPHEPVPSQGGEPGNTITPEKQISREQGHDRPDQTPLGGSALARDLGQIIRNPLLAEFSGDGFFLAGLGMQAPPGGLAVTGIGRLLVPKGGWVAIGLGRQDGHRRTQIKNGGARENSPLVVVLINQEFTLE